MRHLTRAAATTVATLALVAATGATGFAKPPHGGGKPPHAGPPSHAAVCKAEKADVKAAKAELREARRAHHKRGAKVAKAERRLDKQERQAASACSAAAKAAEATARVEANLAGYEQLLADPVLLVLPSDLQTSLATALAAAQVQVQALAGEIDGATAPELAHLVNDLRALDPARLASAVVTLAETIGSADPVLVEQVQDELAAVAAQLAAYDAAGNSPLKSFAGAMLDVVELLVVVTTVEEPVTP
jgi:DNA repair exonuclease SbcCD ATPase subunit